MSNNSSSKKPKTRWVAMHSACLEKEERNPAWYFVHNRQEMTLYIKVHGLENAKWVARQLNKACALDAGEL